MELQIKDNINSEIDLLSFLTKNSLFSKEKARSLQEEASIENISPIDLAIEAGLISEEIIINTISQQENLKKVEISGLKGNDEALKTVPQNFAAYHLILPLKIKNNILLVAIYNPFQKEAIRELRENCKFQVKMVLALKTTILNLINKFYYSNSKALIKIDNYMNFLVEDQHTNKVLMKISNPEIKLLKFLENSKILTGGIIKSLIEETNQFNCSLIELFHEENLISLLSELLGLPSINGDGLKNADKELVKLIPYDFAKKNICFPINQIKKTLSIALFNPFQSETIIELERITGLSVKTVLASKKNIFYAINNNYSLSAEIENVNPTLEGLGGLIIDNENEIKFEDTKNTDDILDISYDDTPVVKMVNFVISRAIREKSSDIHIEAGQNYMLVRNRVDGVLHKMLRLQKWIQGAFVSRIKILAKLDISEKRIPQDGKIQLRFEGKDIDIRVSTLPTNFGESVVLRILNTGDISSLVIDKLGFSPINLEILKNAIHEPQGIILVTGPTGSGKSSTLYSCLKEVNTLERNIITVEDPVEYTIEGINQVYVNKKTGLTFASALRAILRQDPNIIMIGEIRDLETAEIAFNASMTGHLVLSTLHTNDSVSSITRLIDLGIPRYIISSSLLLVMAQRLVRKICPNCSEEYLPDQELLKQFSITDDNIKYKRGKGCAECSNTGYHGRLGIYELLHVNHDIRNEIKMEKSSEEDILNFLKSKDMLFLFDDALNKVKEGLTTFDELIRVLGKSHLK